MFYYTITVPESPLLLITKHRNKEHDHNVLLKVNVTIKEVVSPWLVHK